MATGAVANQRCTDQCRRSSVVERALGKGEVGCSIHPGGTTFRQQCQPEDVEIIAIFLIFIVLQVSVAQDGQKTGLK